MGPDALFKLGHDKKILHGLDTFIDYYRSGKKTGLQHILSDFVPGKAAPAESKLHGSENLLHRASTEGNIVVVTELLASGYRNIDAKNQDSQTAVHLASYSGHIEVLSQLFKYGAKVNIADTEGYTPLHYAAMANKPQSVKMLLESGGANPTMRNELTGWVPLHQAASAGHIDCVTALLESQAPTRPRTGNNETPADLARAGGHLRPLEVTSGHWRSLQAIRGNLRLLVFPRLPVATGGHLSHYRLIEVIRGHYRSLDLIIFHLSSLNKLKIACYAGNICKK